MRINRITFNLELLKRDLTLTELSKASGVSRQVLSAIKSGKTCSDATGEKIASALNVNLADLLKEV